jgi:hypothetical protein
MKTICSILLFLFFLFNFSQEIEIIKRGINPNPSTQNIPPVFEACQVYEQNFSVLQKCTLDKVKEIIQKELTVPEKQTTNFYKLSLTIKFEDDGNLYSYEIPEMVPSYYHKIIEKAFKETTLKIKGKIKPALNVERKPIRFITFIPLYFEK